MTGIWLPLAATVLAAALTYWCCIHPMRRNGSCCPTPPERTAQSVEEEIHRTREERDLLRAQSAETNLSATPGQGPESIRP